MSAWPYLAVYCHFTAVYGSLACRIVSVHAQTQSTTLPMLSVRKTGFVQQACADRLHRSHCGLLSINPAKWEKRTYA